jgi:hypothetical protein
MEPPPASGRALGHLEVEFLPLPDDVSTRARAQSPVRRTGTKSSTASAAGVTGPSNMPPGCRPTACISGGQCPMARRERDVGRRNASVSTWDAMPGGRRVRRRYVQPVPEIDARGCSDHSSAVRPGYPLFYDERGSGRGRRRWLHHRVHDAELAGPARRLGNHDDVAAFDAAGASVAGW